MSEGTSQTPLLSCLSGINTHGGGDYNTTNRPLCRPISTSFTSMCSNFDIYVWTKTNNLYNSS